MVPTVDVSEVDVLERIVVWLHDAGWKITNASFPRGQGRRGMSRPAEKARRPVTKSPEEVKTSWKSHGVPVETIEFRSSGPDVVAVRDGQKWTIQCKGWSMGKKQSHIENFKRGLFSTVLDYDSDPDSRLGLALPEGYFFTIKDASKVSKELRKVLKLWILMITDEGEVEELSPDNALPPD